MVIPVIPSFPAVRNQFAHSCRLITAKLCGRTLDLFGLILQESDFFFFCLGLQLPSALDPSLQNILQNEFGDVLFTENNANQCSLI